LSDVSPKVAKVRTNKKSAGHALAEMTGLVLAGAATVLAASVNAQPASRVDRTADVNAIRAHIESIFQAFVDKDRKKLEETHGADWRGFTPGSGEVIRGLDGYMSHATFPPELAKGQGMVGFRLSDFDVVFYGDTAVASFVADVDRVYGSDIGRQKLTLLDVYHKEPHGWIQVASNTSLHPDEVEQQRSQFREMSAAERGSLLAAREAVWRAWFAGDVEALARLVPPELITIGGSADGFGTREAALAGSRNFVASGAKLTRLVFPRTDLQAYGNTAILYTTYEMDILSGAVTRTERGAATEVFVQQNGRWLNTGWQLAPASSR
jgi:ketosteroid isomerase-like protein